VVPALIDSHVHLAYYPVGGELRRAGVVAAVDLAAPVDTLRPIGPADPRLLESGPMITSVGGYPTQSWGANGYGRPVATAAEATRAVDELITAGAGVIKVPFESPWLADDVVRAVVQAAHRRGRLVVAHALDDAGAARAAALGTDGLAHTPVAPLSEGTVQAWRGRFVISTLRAFGGSATAVDNLRRLRAAGATVLYGTDLGNTRDAAIDAEELRLLGAAGLDGAAILAAATSAPAKIWGWPDLGQISAGARASFLVLDADPLGDPLVLARPREVWMDGRPVP
jgi:imidazolonepropionase-like amidohydrolase